ncbi:hypothetical protein BDZ91DRAFT_711191 [Kalaharituber pfeilii]|nr:hypothetical protein BDZ91DRAFT_711191 [Kalaharituber pfeilii]
MHERSIYRRGVDFVQLGRDCPEFGKYLIKGTSQIDFKDPNAVRALTTALLKRDFKVTVELPEDRLCPPVYPLPNRLNYILWLQDLLDTTSGGPTDSYDPNREVIGLDIGVGASCIYPLLGCASRPTWKFIGTDIDDKSLLYAQKQVSLSDLEGRIKIVKMEEGRKFLDLERFGVTRLDFTMSNPPFYSTPQTSAPFSTHTTPANLTPTPKPPHPSQPPSFATPAELVTPGGEPHFAYLLIQESLHQRSIQWFSLMLGLKSSVKLVVDEIKRVGGKGANWAVTTFIQSQGGKGKWGTRRWGVAWSWKGCRPRWDVAVAEGGVRGVSGVRPVKGEFDVLFADEQEGGIGVGVCVFGKVKKIMEGLRRDAGEEMVRWEEDCEQAIGWAWVRGNVWSRRARRRRGREDVEENGNPAVANTTTTTTITTTITAPDPKNPGIDLEPGMFLRFTISTKSITSSPPPRSPSLSPSRSPSPPSGNHHSNEYDQMDYTLTDARPPESNKGSQMKENTKTVLTICLVKICPDDIDLFESFCGMMRRKLVIEETRVGEGGRG